MGALTISQRVAQQVEEIMQVPVTINNVLWKQMLLGYLHWDDQQGLIRGVFQTARLWNVTAIFVGTEDNRLMLWGWDPKPKVLPNGDSHYVLKVKNRTDEPRREWYADNVGKILGYKKQKPYDVTKREWYIEGKKMGKAYYTGVYTFSQGTVGVSALHPVFDVTAKQPITTTADTWRILSIYGDILTGKLVGVFGVDYELNALQHLLQQMNVGKTGYIFIVELNGNLIASSKGAITQPDKQKLEADPLRLAAHEAPEPIGPMASKMAPNQKWSDVQGMYTEVVVGGEEHFVHVMDISASVPGVDWKLIVVIPHADFLAEIKESNRNTALICAGIALFAAAICTVATLALVRPIQVLSKRMRRAGDMQFDNVEEKGSHITEVSMMQLSFNFLVKQLMYYRDFMPNTLFAGNEEGEEESVGVRSGNLSSRSSRSNRSSQSSRSSRSSHKDTEQLTIMRNDKFANTTASFVVVNVKSFHALLTHGAEFVQKAHATILESLLGIIAGCKGAVADPFNGDRIFISFNVVGRCAAHVTQACALVWSMRAAPKLKLSTPQGEVGVGLSLAVETGRVMCGLLGCTGMRRHAVIGTPVNMCYLMERLNQTYNTSVLTSERVYEAAGHAYKMLMVDCISSAKISGSQGLYMFMEKQNDKEDDEWMYELQAMSKSDPTTTAHNEAFQKLQRGKTAAAKSIVQTISDSENPFTIYLMHILEQHPDNTPYSRKAPREVEPFDLF
eukprot:NODE_160_length_2334_cov_111.713348_g138_i0.p1 GENE.NODE_160_length_2334_cov_111.713348_g138_i0~~NODE_160_length_2334_cov_111.713348_g138_i0.p1  ORF type:complete len:739 (-),score=193.33 NODE_160_length_2334_cov_111.713348_g138_i0:117-2309(-)